LAEDKDRGWRRLLLKKMLLVGSYDGFSDLDAQLILYNFLIYIIESEAIGKFDCDF